VWRYDREDEAQEPADLSASASGLASALARDAKLGHRKGGKNYAPSPDLGSLGRGSRSLSEEFLFTSS